MKKLIITTLCALFLLPFGEASRGYAQYTDLLNFAGANGSYSTGDLISDGTFLYGMTCFGGINGMGTIFKIMPNGSGYVKLLDFSGMANGRNPVGSLISDGTFLYGMTYSGGANDSGVVFKIMSNGSGYLKLVDCVGIANGSHPRGSLITDGTFLYGMTPDGGTNNMGTIFKIMPDGSGYVKLLDFAGTTNGSNPRGSLILDGTFLYGMTSYGGINNKGTIFKIMPNGSGYVKLLDFAGATNGRNPSGSLISDGTYLYGVTDGGGTNLRGTIFKIKPDGSGYLKLLDFAGIASGSGPIGPLIMDGAFLYGMTHSGGSNDKGTIFKILYDGSGYLKLLDFTVAGNGREPYGSLITDGTFLYGMTYQGGTNDLGTIFKYQYPTTSITENNEETNLQVYPNPTTGKINIVCKKEQINATLEVLNMVGQVIMSVKNINIQQGESYLLDMSFLDDGTYIIRLNKSETIIVKT